uniref:Methylosome protein 50 n=1 Tax=Cacopsylla melanoneura TaxID=428564 RepID=A0A8D8WRK0_9HEMI
MESPRKNLNIIGVEKQFEFDMVPPNIDKHLEFVEISTDGELLLGSSNLNGCYWTGSIWYFLEPGNAPQREKVYSGLNCDSGICDGKFLSENKVIIGEDLGMVSILHLHKDQTFKKEHSKFTVESSRSEHDHAVLSVSVSGDKQKAVTGSMDKCIKVWDVSSNKDLLSEHTYRPAHKDHVTSVAMKQESSEGSTVFASCSLDGAALLWDTRMPKPAQVIYEDVAIGLKSVAWYSDNQVVIGSTLGELCVADTRARGLTFQTIVSSPRPIHRIVVHKNLVAMCADDTYVRVIDMNKLTTSSSNNDNISRSTGLNTSLTNSTTNPAIIYSDGKHKDYVRGLTWAPDSGTLISCAWDRQVLCHNIGPVIS